MSPSTGVVGVAVLLAILFGWALAGEYMAPLVILIVVALVPVFLRWPIVSTFGLYAFLLPFDTVTAAYGTMSFTRPVSVLTAAVLAVAALTERRLRRPPLPALWWGLVVVWCAVGSMWAIDSDMVFRRLPSVLSLFLVYVVAMSIVPSRTEFHSVCVLAVIGGATAAAVAYLYGLESQGRVTLTVADRVANPNTFSAGLILPLALGIAGFVGLKGIVQRSVAVGAVCLVAMGIYVSGSRGALVAGGVMLLVLLCRIGIKKETVAIVVILFLFALIVPGPLLDRVDLLFTGEDATGSGRLDIWQIGFQAVQRFGILGAGLDSFPSVYGMYAPLGPRVSGAGAHNSFLMVWVELGVLGLVLILAVLAGHLFALRRARKAGRAGLAAAALEAACFAALALSMFGDEVWTKQFWLPWILLTWATYFPRELHEVSNTHAVPR